ncbi:MAG: penicillin-binding protein 2 [Proteobacteria bacterium]|nr:penicillin-binding protein 2 [Pseudomonadota bacterium]
MRKEGDREKTLTRRALMLGAGQLTLFGVLASRMYYLQVIEADQYKMLADENRINLRLLPPLRGRIIDRFGVELANNERNYRVVLIPEQTKDVEQTLARLSELIPIPNHERRRILRDTKRMRSFVPISVTENLSWEQFSRINVASPDLPGIQPDVGEKRFYPYGPAFAHVAGYVAPVSEEELTNDPVLQLPGFRIGKSGIEKTLDLELRGTAGNSRVEVNAYGRVIRELARRDGEIGRDVRLTIDAKLQNYAIERFGDGSGACVVMDIHGGEVLALVSNPAFEPNAFNLGLSRNEWQALVGDERKPLSNKAITGQYPPGSTFKMVVAQAALEAGAIGTEHQVFCPGFVDLGDRRFHCWKKHGHGNMSMTSALQQSCDVFFFDIAKRVGVDRIAVMARRFGFGDAALRLATKSRV